MDDDLPVIESEEDLELLELQDQAEEIGFLTPREYAKARGMNPQLIYYHIRVGNIQDERCKCGRRVLDVRATDETLQTKAATRGRILDTRSDESRAGDAGGSEA